MLSVKSLPPIASTISGWMSPSSSGKEVGPRVAVARPAHAVVGEVLIGVIAVHDLESIVVEHDAVPAESGVDRPPRRSRR